MTEEEPSVQQNIKGNPSPNKSHITVEPPLRGIRVLDLTRVLAGPFCSMTLADLGAEIIKVEIPGSGDDTRAYPPFIKCQSSYFLSLNRGKESITLNLKNKKAQEAIYRLVEKCDVFLENFRPGITTQLGVDYKTLRKVNPRLIYCSISSFGQTGPYSLWPGYDLIIQGMSGLMSFTGEPDGPPVRVGMAVADIGAGMYAIIGILSALRVRDKTGMGQYIDISLLDSSVSWLTFAAGSYFATGKAPTRMGSGHPSLVPYQAFEAGDGKSLLIAAANDRLWELLCKGMGLDNLKDDPRYTDGVKRVENRDILIPFLIEEFKKRPRDVWLEMLKAVGFPCGPVYSVEEVFSDPQVLEREMLVEMKHPEAGIIKQIGPVIKFSETQCVISIPPPLLGEHTKEILRSIAGYSDRDIDELHRSGAI